jgi:hypothetical protein
MRKIVRCSIGVGLALLLPIPLFAQEQCENRWRPLEASSGQTADIPALEQLARDFPDSGSVRLRLLTALLDAERNAEAVRTGQCRGTLQTQVCLILAAFCRLRSAVTLITQRLQWAKCGG